MCLTGRLPFSNYLAAGFRFHLYSMCIPLPRNFNIGCCANEKLPARSIFHVYVCINIGLGGRGGAPLNLIQVLESIVILETHECTSSVST